jgi:hypothetical protein
MRLGMIRFWLFVVLCVVLSFFAGGGNILG